MGCCGETIRQLENIVIGNINMTQGKKHEFTDELIRICKEDCEWSTWLTIREYATFLLRHNIKIITNFTQLDKLPLLPKYKQDESRMNLFCRICKCYIPSAARAPAKKCSKGLWPILKEESNDKE